MEQEFDMDLLRDEDQECFDLNSKYSVPFRIFDSALGYDIETLYYDLEVLRIFFHHDVCEWLKYWYIISAYVKKQTNRLNVLAYNPESWKDQTEEVLKIFYDRHCKTVISDSPEMKELSAFGFQPLDFMNTQLNLSLSYLPDMRLFVSLIKRAKGKAAVTMNMDFRKSTIGMLMFLKKAYMANPNLLAENLKMVEFFIKYRNADWVWITKNGRRIIKSYIADSGESLSSENEVDSWLDSTYPRFRLGKKRQQRRSKRRSRRKSK